MGSMQANLSAAERALLAKRLQKALTKQAKAPAIEHKPTDEPAPLSFAQQRLWFLYQWAPDSPVYNIPLALRMVGQLDVAALRDTLDEIVRRHQVLQMLYVTVAEAPVQIPHPDPSLALNVIDLGPLPAGERQTQMRRLVNEEARKPFDLERELSIRANLLRLGEKEHALLLTMHHIASDGWSLGVLVKELAALYEAFCAGRPSPLPELPLQYADFAYWQRRWLQDEVLEEQMAYWKRQLAGMPAVLELPADRPRPPVRTYNGAAYDFSLLPSLTRAIRTLSHREGVTPFMVLLAAFQALLHRYTGQVDIAIGSPVAGRGHSELEGLIGCFVNTPVLRTDLSGNPTARELLQRVREVTLGAFAHQDLPFEKLVEELRPERNLSYSPLFQVMFAFDNTPQTAFKLPGLTVTYLDVDFGTAQFDLSLSIQDAGKEVTGAFICNTDLFELDTIRRMARHFQTLLAGVVADLEQNLARLPLLTAAERRQLVEWNETQIIYPQTRCIHQLFEAQVERTPDATAVVFENRSLSYQELNRRANRVAHRVQKLGVGPEVLVGICVERSLEMVIGLLGILKAGGAYVPLDPAYPQDRLAFMLKDAHTPLLLTQERLRKDLPVHEAHASPEQGRKVICLDADWTDVAGEWEENPTTQVTDDNLAYVIYTSGSTGKPKGAMNTHAGIRNRLLWMQETYQLNAADRIVQKTPFSFDVSVWEFFWPLLTSACLVVARPEGHKDSAYLVKLIIEQEVTTMHFVPSMLQIFLEERGLQACTSLKRVICSGEALPFDLQERFFAHLDAELHNLYGPTEAAIDVTFWPCDRESDGRIVPIGAPIANTQIHLLDAHLQPVPIGVPGELYIGGVGLARGYLNRPELSAEKFIPAPLLGETRGQTGARLYKTGDLARYHPDGSVEFLRRIDFQVKIRGFRIELGEIETALSGHPAVREAAVIATLTARKDTPGEKQLVAYVVPAQEHTPSTSELRDALKAQLPEYMIPVAFVLLEALPLTPNGKVNRRALPAPERTRSGPGVAFVAPRNEAETRIAAIWSELLRVERVGIDDNFFDLGGESFKAIRAARRIGASVSVIDVFKHPTVRDLAAFLSLDRPKSDGLLHELTNPIFAQDRVLALICVPYPAGSAIIYQPLANALPEGYSLYALERPGNDYSRRDEARLPLKELARQCVEEIRRDITGPIALYGHCMGGALAIEIARLLEQAGVQVLGIFIGAHFPLPRLPGKLFAWLSRLFPSDRFTSKRMQHEFLRAMGGFTDAIDPEELEFLMQNFLRDGREVEDYYTTAYAQREQEKLKAPILSIIGQRDRATEFYKEQFKDWKFFSDRVDLVVVPQAGHYFTRHQPDELAHIITRQMAVWQGKAPETTHLVESGLVPDDGHLEEMGQISPGKQVNVTPSLFTFFLIALGQFVSLVGTGLTSFALGVWVYQRTGSVSIFAFISVFAMLPGIILSPIAGAVADRWDRRLIMLLSDTTAACATLALALLLWTDSLQIWHIYVTAGIGSIANAFQQPAYNAAIAQLVPKRYLGRANGIAQLGGATGTLFAPLLGGALVTLVGLYGVILIDFITFLFAVATLLLVRFPDTLFRKREEPLLKEVVGGWRYMTKRRGLVAMVIFFVVVNYLSSIVEVLVTPLVLSFGSPAALGTVMAASGAGMLVGSLVMSLWGGTKRRTEGIVGFVLLLGLSALVTGARPAPIYPAIGFFGLGASIAFVNAHWLALVQVKVGLELQGRVLATNQMLVWSMVPLGFISAGPLADKVFEPLMAHDGRLAASVGRLIGSGPGRGMGLIMILVGVILVIWVILGYRYRPLRYMEDDLPDAIPDAVIVADKDELQKQADQQLLADAV